MPAQSTGSSIHVSFQLVYFAQRLVVVLRFLSVSSAAFAMLEICRVTLVWYGFGVFFVGVEIKRKTVMKLVKSMEWLLYELWNCSRFKNSIQMGLFLFTQCIIKLWVLWIFAAYNFVTQDQKAVGEVLWLSWMAFSFIGEICCIALKLTLTFCGNRNNKVSSSCGFIAIVRGGMLIQVDLWSSPE